MPRNDHKCLKCGTIDERFEKVADIDAGTPQICKCGEKMKRLPPLVNGWGEEFNSFDSQTFECHVATRSQLQDLRKQYNLKPVDREKKFIPTAGKIYSYAGQGTKTSRANSTYKRPH